MGRLKLLGQDGPTESEGATIVARDMIGVIQGLLAKAEGTDNTAERDAFLSKAEALMLKYTIDEEAVRQAAMAKGAKAERVVTRRFDVAPGGSPVGYQLVILLDALCRHHGCRLVVTSSPGKYFEDAPWKVSMFGFEGELRFVELLFSSLHVQLAARVAPSVDSKLSYDENVAILHDAGIKWAEIANMLNRAALTGAAWEATPWPDGGRLKRAYKRQCVRDGRAAQLGMNPRGYAAAFAEEYVSAVRFRLGQIKQEAAGTDLVLADRKAAVDAAFADATRGSGTLARQGASANGAARLAGRAAGRSADLSGGRNNVAGGARRSLS